MTDKMLAGYQRARNKANYRRDNPSRQEMCLRTAIKRLGYPIKYLEYEAHDTDTQRSMWFDVAYEYNNRLVLIDLKPRDNFNENQAAAYKRQYAIKYHMPYLVVQPGAVAEIQAQIIQWHQLRRWKDG